MRRVGAACAILLALLLGCTAALLYLQKSIGVLEEELTHIEALLDRQQKDEACVFLEEAVSGWEQKERFLARLTHRRELEAVTQTLVSLRPYLEQGDSAGFYAALAQIRLMLHRIRESEIPTPGNLL